MVEHRPIIEGIMQAMNSNDFSVYHRYFTEDFVDEMPQSGELIRGQDNARWILENYPGAAELKRSLDATAMRNQASDEIKIIAPTFSIVKLEGRGNEGTTTFRGRYPDGSIWWIIILYQLRGDRICKSTTFYAQEFQAPEWRAGHVERMPGH